MIKRQLTKNKISITLDSIDFYEFKKYCKLHAYKVSTRINVLIKRDMNDCKRRLP